MEHLDLTIDFETCALSSNAAVIQVAIVPWLRYNGESPFISKDDAEPYVSYVDLRSCIVEGMDFDPATIQWWSRQSKKAKQSLNHGLAEPIIDVFTGMLDYVRDLTARYQIESICIWSQGMDIDIAILRSLSRRFGVELEKVIPHTSFRDCRTLILEAALIAAGRSMSGRSTTAIGIALPLQLLADPALAYKIFPALPDNCVQDLEAHDALYDALRSTWYTWQAMRELRK